MKLRNPVLDALLKPLLRKKGDNLTIDDQISARAHGPYGDASVLGERDGAPKGRRWFGAGSPENLRQEKRSGFDQRAEEASENEGMAEHAEKSDDPQLWADTRDGRVS
jgi:hypothetical protein